MFGFIKNNALKAKAAVIVQNLLEMRAEEGDFTGDAGKTANYLVGKAWDERPSALKQFKPQDVTLAAAGLISGIRGKSHRDTNVNAMLYALVLIIKEVSDNRGKYDMKFHAHDHLIMEEAVELIESV